MRTLAAGAWHESTALYAKHIPMGWPDDIEDAANLIDTQHPIWQRLSTGERAFVRLCASLFGAPDAMADLSIFAALSALDRNLQHEVGLAIFTAVQAVP